MTPPSVDLDALEAAAKAATAGPWRWELNEKGKTISLEGGKPKFDMSVIRFRRYGMAGAMPEFQVDGLMRPATDFAKVVPGREHHASWFKGIDHPDANYIAAASPDVILRLTAELRKARETIAAHHSGESVTAREFMATLDKDEERDGLRRPMEALLRRVDERPPQARRARGRGPQGDEGRAACSRGARGWEEWEDDRWMRTPSS
jgi:hypothetical protein